MKKTAYVTTLLIGSLLGAAALPAEARADRRHHSSQRWEERAPRAVKQAPYRVPAKHYRGHEHVRVGKHDYYHRNGRFFRPGPKGLIAVRAPIGAIVAGLPVGFSMVISGGTNYYQAGGIYYNRVPGGYMVVDEPRRRPDRDYAGKAPRYVAVNSALLNIRGGPGLNFGIAGQVGRGQRLPVYGDREGWYYIEQPNGARGWIMADFALR
ncbi:MAG: DUF6515 family protein [Trichloromonas sp.]|jgi:uncharacterized protein YgiM (DUF1202 family)|nr:DUF6515 family protein [Trichloromonas sp.]